MEMKGVKAIIFDSGRTLNVPRTGHWFITPNFFNIIENSNFTYTEEKLDEAMGKAFDHINKILLVETEEDEFSMFKEFYK
ncbi:MAG TPA: HAD family hydrolase, partial [Clostridium sp.]|nr:HAD family hydrolase [Clostridium sp.]